MLTTAKSRNKDGGHNPGNNLHVSSLSHKVSTSDLEAAFAKVGRVRSSSNLLSNQPFFFVLFLMLQFSKG
jgi:hypothetical protein